MNFFNSAVLILLSGSLLSCMQTENSSAQDRLNYGGPAGGTPEFIAARQVLRTNCVICHAEYGQSETALRLETTLMGLPLVVPGNPENSPLYYRIRNSEGPNGPKNMPQSSPLSVSDLNLIRTWIEGITP